jgi:hypothetical protein
MAYGKSECSIKLLELLQNKIFHALLEWSKALSLGRISDFKDLNTCTRFFSSFFTFFWHHPIIDKAKVQNC